MNWHLLAHFSGQINSSVALGKSIYAELKKFNSKQEDSI